MGHDIYAYKRQYRTEEAREAAYQRIVTQTITIDQGAARDTWREQYEAYGDETQVAYFRRSMGYYRGPVGDLLYIVLGDKAQACNGGVSGIGESAIFGIEELMLAKRRVLDVRPNHPEEETDDELRFIQACIDYAADDERREVLIYFG